MCPILLFPPAFPLTETKVTRHNSSSESKVRPKFANPGPQQDKTDKTMGAKEPEEEPSPSKSKLKTSKDVHFCVLPDKYEPLVEDRDEEEEREDAEERRRRKEEKKRKKKLRYKKYRKNAGKALRFSWRCLIAGLQSMLPVYMGPMAAAASVVPGNP